MLRVIVKQLKRLAKLNERRLNGRAGGVSMMMILGAFRLFWEIQGRPPGFHCSNPGALSQGYVSVWRCGIVDR